MQFTSPLYLLVTSESRPVYPRATFTLDIVILPHFPGYALLHPIDIDLRFFCLVTRAFTRCQHRKQTTVAVYLRFAPLHKAVEVEFYRHYQKQRGPSRKFSKDSFTVFDVRRR